MKKISTVISELVRQSSFLEDGLYKGYINLTAFAESIRPFVEKETQKKVSVHAIKMALSRFEIPIACTKKQVKS
jgi:hypothetical protein